MSGRRSCIVGTSTDRNCLRRSGQLELQPIRLSGGGRGIPDDLPHALIVEELKVIELEAKETDKALGKILKQLGI